MLTYVINTSENRTFDSDLLFKLARYNKIKWFHCALDEIQKCAEEIYEKQNMLGADSFRIAVIVDFYTFDRIRIPYGRRGFGTDNGVDVSIYLPYIEMFLLDKVATYLENKNLFAYDFEVYYIQNEKSERYELFENAFGQFKQIMSGKKEAISEASLQIKEEPACYADDTAVTTDTADSSNEAGDGKKEKKAVQFVYDSFQMYCTPELTLDFALVDYPYGKNSMTLKEFWDVTRERTAIKSHIRRHYYFTPYGIGASRAALDALSLALYLIRIYEREETLTIEEMEVLHLDSDILREVLEDSWIKINATKNVIKGNSVTFYDLDQNDEKLVQDEEELEPKEAIFNEKIKLSGEITKTNMSCEKLYRTISEFSEGKPGEVKKRNREEFDSIMSAYLENRDATRESDVEAEFYSMKSGGFMKTTDKCPSKSDYDYLVDKKQKEISVLFDNALNAGYIAVDYKDEKEAADKAYVDYQKAMACMKRSFVGDLVLMILVVLSMFVPYLVLQLTSYNVSMLTAILLGINNIALFVGIFVLAVVLQIFPQMKKVKKARRKLLNCYVNCCAKERYSFSAIRRRYERDLVLIENARYDLRHMKRLYEENQRKEKNIRMHHEMLEKLEDCLGSILNNLDVELVINPMEVVEVEFDLNKPFTAKENSVYQVFSVEIIERMFPRKGSDEK